MENHKAQTGGSHSSCPQCGEPVVAGVDECPACGQPLCPECGAAVGEHWPSCMACGARWDLLCPECKAVVKPRHRHCPSCGVSLEADPDEVTPAPPPRPTPPVSAPPAISGQSIPACMVCGRQDETLRLALFPYVFSLVFLTFRRAFGGIWCQKHRNLYWALSSLITALVGWFGIPFGFVFTPLTLIKLARGGEQTAAQNQHLLQVLAGHKLRLGDTEGAIRCLEAALRVNDDEAGRRRLQDLYAQTRPSAFQESYARLWPLVGAILVAIALGMTIGLLDYAVTAAFSALFGEEGNFLVVILSWTPWVAMLFLGGLGLVWLVDWALRRIGCRQMGLAIVFAVVMAAVALYGTQQGVVIAGLVAEAGAGEELGGVFDTLLVAWFGLTVGGGSFFLDQVRSGELSGLINLIVALVATVYYVEASVRAARGAVRWQQALAAVRAGGEPPRVRVLQRGWLAIAAVFVCTACSLVSLPFAGGAFSFGESMARIEQAGDLHEQGQVDLAVAEMEALVQEDPNLALAHGTLGILYLERGQFDQAAEEMEAAVELQPDWAIWHATLANVYYLIDQTDRVEEELRRAEELGADDGFTQSMAGNIYYMMAEFATAEERFLQARELSPDELWGYLGLARAYAAQTKYEQALEVCEQALEQGEDPADVHVARGYVYIRQEDLDRAGAAFSAALEVAPEDASVHSALSYLYFLRGEIAESLREAEEAVRLDPYNRAAHENLAFALHTQGDLDRALAEAQEAVRLNPKNDTVHYILGLCYRDKGESQEAVQAFETFLDLYTDRAYVRDWKVEAEAYLADQE